VWKGKREKETVTPTDSRSYLSKQSNRVIYTTYYKVT